MKGLTGRQQEILDLIRSHIKSNGLPPTRADIARIFGFNVKANMQAKTLSKREGIRISNFSIIYEVLDEAQRIILNESPWVQICNPDFSLVRNSDLKGWVYRTFNHTKAQDFYWV